MPTITFSQLGKLGRLGNSMFQIAAVIGAAKEYGDAYVFPEWPYSKHMFIPLPVGTVKVDRIWNESTYRYSAIPNFGMDCDIAGYFQSNLYFEKHWFDILPYFTLKDEHHYYIWNKYVALLNQRTVSIHVRRGDYLVSPALEWHGVLGMDYYEAALDTLYTDGQHDVLKMVFSDDIAWCKQKFTQPNTIFVEGELDVIDLFIASYCMDNIIANSSFSWWQAYLNKNVTKRVVAPKRWFTENAKLDTKDLYCKDWIVV